MTNRSLAVVAIALVAGCGNATIATDAGRDTGSGDIDSGPPPVDSGPADTGVADDSGAPIDAPIDTGPPSDAGPTLDCATYCGRIMANCLTPNAQYRSVANCMDTCGAFPPGTLADLGGNTLGCRIYHAGAAAGDPGMHCRHAGPTGDGACGENCLSFCTIAEHECPLEYGTQAECETICAGYATTPPYSTATTSGDSFACRMYHLTAASTDPDGHCSHIPMVSIPCGG